MIQIWFDTNKNAYRFFLEGKEIDCITKIAIEQYPNDIQGDYVLVQLLTKVKVFNEKPEDKSTKEVEKMKEVFKFALEKLEDKK